MRPKNDKESESVERGGVWVDHRRACAIKFASDGEAHMTQLVSESPGNRANRGSMGGAQGHFRRFYADIVEIIREVEHLAILGPGLAKKEFESVLRQRAERVRIVAVLTTDQMTEPQIVSKMRDLLCIRKRE